MRKPLFLFFTILIISLAPDLRAQGGPPCGQPPCGGGGGGGGKPCAQPPCVPIDQGTTLLLIGGAILGFYAFKKTIK